jgi:phospholipid/cholesterol/gamma-HCH transport system substrate-binding protein
MLSQRTIETFVGLFLLAAIGALLVLAFKVSGLTSFFKAAGYNVTAEFEDIGSLKIRAPVKIGGVLIGEVSNVVLDPITFKAVVTLHIDKRFNVIPDDSAVSILTAGLLGDNYIAINPGYNQTFLKNGSVIEDTHSAMILEKLIGQMIYKLSNPTPAAGDNKTTKPAEEPGKNLEKEKAIPGLAPTEQPKKPVIPDKQPEVETNYERNI